VPEGGQLFTLTEAAIRELGFDRLALVHGLWFRRPSPALIRLDNFGEYADLFIERRLYEDDPRCSLVTGPTPPSAGRTFPV
jgi:hypothetical protein